MTAPATSQDPRSANPSHARTGRAIPVVGAKGVRSTTMLQLHGELNLKTVPHIAAVLEAALNLSDRQLTIDLTDATSISSEILSALIFRSDSSTHLEVIWPETVPHPAAATNPSTTSAGKVRSRPSADQLGHRTSAPRTRSSS